MYSCSERRTWLIVWRRSGDVLSHHEVFSITNTTKDGAGRVSVNKLPVLHFGLGGVHMPTSSHANAANQGSDNSDSPFRN